MALWPALSHQFKSAAQPDWASYRYGAQLLADLDQPTLLGLLLTWAADVDDPDVREVINDFAPLVEHPSSGRPVDLPTFPAQAGDEDEAGWEHDSPYLRRTTPDWMFT
ncbi:hypothetical protein [Pseudofrankia asymbiotica]|uniref:Uncharacterized protein n=1 Tax=Pseudofrankia asymbiotica TaxID=1834516 RepID=A0A1V2IGJ8_9ACTN|nr:hypothetical protein [Pseudofrankia asymbiotica]ONH31586.1 hypothetical protein BL253_07825 [Pseudofrankia asymbiotica]